MHLANNAIPYLKKLEIDGVVGSNIPEDKVWEVCVAFIHRSNYPLKFQLVSSLLCELAEIPWTFWQQHIERCLRAKAEELNTPEAMYKFAVAYSEFVSETFESGKKFGAELQEF